MKLTWFAKSCFRLHIGGQIIVTDPHETPENVAPHELTSGADTVLDLGANDLPVFLPESWTKRRPKSFIESGSEPPPALWRLGTSGLLIDPPGDDPLVLADADTAWDRFADGAVVVLLGQPAAMPRALAALAGNARPRLVAIAADSIDRNDISSLAAAASDVAVQVLEPALALEA